MLGKSKAVFILESVNGSEYTDVVQFQQKRINILSVPVRILLKEFYCKFKLFSLRKVRICSCELNKSSISPFKIQFIFIFCFPFFSHFFLSYPTFSNLSPALSFLPFQPNCLKKQRLYDCGFCPPTYKQAFHNLRT